MSFEGARRAPSSFLPQDCGVACPASIIRITITAYLVERFNPAKCLLRLGSVPVLHKLLLVQISPFDYQAQYPRGQPAGKKRKIPYLDQSLIVPINGMKVRRVMLLKKHLDHNSEKTADLRHVPVQSAKLERPLRPSYPWP